MGIITCKTFQLTKKQLQDFRRSTPSKHNAVDDERLAILIENGCNDSERTIWTPGEDEDA
jgi:hypothetical protein